MVPSAHLFGVWVRTAQALSGPAPTPEFGDGTRVLHNVTQCRDCELATF